MIVSHLHRFIFVKTRKTAGTSVEIALSKICGPEDIISRISPEDEKMRAALGGRGPQNDTAPWSSYTVQDWVRLLRQGKRRRTFMNHHPASYIRRHVGDAIWGSYFKFCIERNPWDKVISAWYYRKSRGDNRSLRDYIMLFDLRRASDWRRYTQGDQLLVDQVIRFEDLAAGMEEVRARIGAPELPEIPRAKSAFRTDRRPYWEVLAPDERDRIAEVFSKEIEHFGYTFLPEGAASRA
jgi:hypothetical protein